MQKKRMATLADESLDKKQDYDSIMIEKEVDISQLKNAETFQTKLSACFYKKGNISKRQSVVNKTQSQSKIQNKENFQRQYSIRTYINKQTASDKNFFSITTTQTPSMVQKSYIPFQSVQDSKKDLKQYLNYKGRKLFDSPGVQAKDKQLPQRKIQYESYLFKESLKSLQKLINRQKQKK